MDRIASLPAGHPAGGSTTQPRPLLGGGDPVSGAVGGRCRRCPTAVWRARLAMHPSGAVLASVGVWTVGGEPEPAAPARHRARVALARARAASRPGRRRDNRGEAGPMATYRVAGGDEKVSGPCPRLGASARCHPGRVVGDRVRRPYLIPAPALGRRLHRGSTRLVDGEPSPVRGDFGDGRPRGGADVCCVSARGWWACRSAAGWRSTRVRRDRYGRVDRDPGRLAALPGAAVRSHRPVLPSALTDLVRAHAGDLGSVNRSRHRARASSLALHPAVTRRHNRTRFRRRAESSREGRFAAGQRSEYATLW